MLPSSALFTVASFPLGFNDADTLGSSSILIYFQPEQRLFTQSNTHDAMVIKGEIKKWFN